MRRDGLEAISSVARKGPFLFDQISDHSILQTTPPTSTFSYGNHGELWSFDYANSYAFASPFQDVFFSSLSNFDVGVDFANSDVFLGHEYGSSSSYNEASNQAIRHYDADGASNDDQRRKILVNHFVESANPVSVILPITSEWAFMSRSLLAMANESSFLLSAICALSALHIYIAKGDNSFIEALQNYKASSREVTAILDDANIEDRQLKHAFATTFLLAHVELMAQTTSKAKQSEWPLQHLQTAHHRVRQHSDRIRLWTGMSKRLLTWMTLLQTKAEYNSGSAILEHSSATLSKSIGDPFARRPSSITTGDSPTAMHHNESNGDIDQADAENDTRTMAEIAFDTMNQPGFDFYLKSQAFTSRIISLDRYHRNRGTPEIELETLKDGQRISSDLHLLWATRPTTMAFLKDPRGLEEALQPKLAKRVLLNLRVYMANFYALFIYLHRVAYKTYPATTDVRDAISRIVGLAKDILDDSVQTRRQSGYSRFDGAMLPGREDPAVAGRDHTGLPGPGQATNGLDPDIGLPATMLWPLFLAAIEGDVPDRLWVLQIISAMDKKHVPNAARTVMLLEEVIRRQDREGRRVDHRSVRKDLFEGELSVMY